MTNIKGVLKQIQFITQVLAQKTLLKVYNFPIEKNKELSWQNFSGIFYQLKQEDYNYIYKEIIYRQNYNFVFLDGAIIQMMYKFSNCGNNILSHRLAYYPKIDIEQFGEIPEEYEENFYGLRSFGDLSYKNNLSTPIRFDYDNDKDKFKERLHSYSHFTIGGYKNCRITVNSPLTPFHFIKFILKSFYYEKTVELNLLDTFDDKFKFDETITDSEKEDIHFNI